MKHLIEIGFGVHCEGAQAAGEFTLCGAALDGENGDKQMLETMDPINCPNCIGIIRHCQSVRGNQIKSKRRR